MFKLTITAAAENEKNESTTVLFSKLFRSEDRDAVLEGIPEDASRVLFVDTGATPVLVETVTALCERGVKVVLRDHHRGEGRSPEAAEELEQLLGERATIVAREDSPACAGLVEAGEFAGAVIVADPDLDGLTAAMKAAGVTYPGLASDAHAFDVRPLQTEERLTPLGWTAVRALSALPPFNPKRPEVSERAKQALFERFVRSAQGDEESLAALEADVAVYERGVQEAQRLLDEEMTTPAPGVVIVNSVGAERSDLNTLTKGMEAAGGRVTGVRKDFGPIAGSPGGHGVQISLAVSKRHQKEIDLRDLVPEGASTGPQAGLLSNTSFLLHCSEQVWEELILPGLKKVLGG